MNTKFIRDEFGLSLEIVGSNDNERALMNELMGLSLGGRAKRGMQALVRMNDRKVVLARPIQFLKFRYIIFSEFRELYIQSFENTCHKYVFFRITDNGFLLLSGNGIYTLYEFSDNSFFTPEYAILIGSEIVFSYFGGQTQKRYNYAWATKVTRRIQTASDLAQALS